LCGNWCVGELAAEGERADEAADERAAEFQTQIDRPKASNFVVRSASTGRKGAPSQDRFFQEHRWGCISAMFLPHYTRGPGSINGRGVVLASGQYPDIVLAYN
jgi:hypothetical protein